MLSKLKSGDRVFAFNDTLPALLKLMQDFVALLTSSEDEARGGLNMLTFIWGRSELPSVSFL
jgi:hypothetical protein